MDAVLQLVGVVLVGLLAVLAAVVVLAGLRDLWEGDGPDVDDE